MVSAMSRREEYRDQLRRKDGFDSDDAACKEAARAANAFENLLEKMQQLPAKSPAKQKPAKKSKA